METLDEYLTDQFHSDRRDLEEVEEVLREASKTLTQSFRPRKAWPYKIHGETGYEWPTRDTGREYLSHSTTVMVLLSIEKLLGSDGKLRSYVRAPRFPSLELNDSDRTDLERLEADAFNWLIRDIIVGGQVETRSGTYGNNDLFTLTYLTDLSAAARLDEANLQIIKQYIRRRIQELRRQKPNSHDQSRFFSRSNGYSVVPNSFIPLRAAQVIKATSIDTDLPGYRSYFEETIHNQLSFTSIPDSRFDPAELAFSLEGLLISQLSGDDHHHQVDHGLFKRVVEVLTNAQEESAYWRPTKPILASAQGMVLFPISVEVANSLLRACELADGRNLHDTFGSVSIGLFRRYWRWLRARAVRFHLRPDRTHYLGWHSENVNDPNLIHVWETSQVIEFLLNLRRLLQAHIARTTLIRSRFVIRPYGKQRKKWRDIVRQFESVTALGAQSQIYKRLESDFVEGWLPPRRRPENYSILLYGPPGTGKTTVAENLADALGFPMVTITVSDFLAGGDAQIEARAKAIFQVLSSQSECVVLFDEIDSFLLDRDSQLYRDQDTVFQFMTPGMLTKLNDLRRQKRILFVVSTNYENRIDPAIKRPGRIDRRYLVLPPDSAARRKIIEELTSNDNVPAELHLSTIRNSAWPELSVASLFLGYKDIEGCVAEARRTPQRNIGELIKILRNRARTTNLSVYATRFGAEAKEAPPIEEFLWLLGLALESIDMDTDDEGFLNRNAIKKAADFLAPEPSKPVSVDLVRKWAPGMYLRVAREAASVLSRVKNEV